jgi:hypothetical protein
MMRAVLLVLMLASGGQAFGQVAPDVALRICLDDNDRMPAPAIIAACTTAIERARPRPDVMARALAARAGRLAVREAPGDLDAAVADLDRALSLDRQWGYATRRAVVRFQRGDFAPGAYGRFWSGETDAAIAEVGRVIASAPDDPDPRIARASMRLIRGDMAEGEADLRTAAALWQALR